MRKMKAEREKINAKVKADTVRLTGGKLEFLTTATLNRSVIYGLLANLNPFLTRY